MFGTLIAKKQKLYPAQVFMDTTFDDKRELLVQSRLRSFLTTFLSEYENFDLK